MASRKHKNKILRKRKHRHALRGFVLPMFTTSRGRFALSIVAFFSLSIAFFVEHFVAATIVAVTQAIFVRIAAGAIVGGLKEGAPRPYGNIRALARVVEGRVALSNYSRSWKRKKNATKKRALYTRKKPRTKLVVMEFDD